MDKKSPNIPVSDFFTLSTLEIQARLHQLSLEIRVKTAIMEDLLEQWEILDNENQEKNR